MERLIEIIQAIEGVDEMGASKAVCNVSIQRGTNDSDIIVEAGCNTMNAVVSMCAAKVWVMVDLRFENSLDYDLIQITKLCADYVQMVKNEMGKYNKPLSLVVSLTPAGEYDALIIGRDGFWSLIPSEAGGEPDTIRFIFMAEDFGAYELSEDAVEQMIGEVCMELEG